MHTLKAIYEHKLVAVIRGVKEDDITAVASALHEGGIHILEITAETPNAAAMIEKLTTKFQDELIIGAGTVLDAETARTMIMAGASFIFAPTVNTDTIRMTKRYGAVSIPGALTPTGILTAYEQGADIVKVFPAQAMGAGYIKDIHGPLQHIPLMPTGGINLQNIQEYFLKGAIAAGLGGSLVDSKKPMDKMTLAQITENARQFSNKVKDL